MSGSKRSAIVLFVLYFFIFGLLPNFMQAQQDKAILSVNLAGSVRIEVGDTFEVVFNAKNATGLYTFQLEGSFESQYLKVGDKDLEEGKFTPFASVGLEARNLIDNKNGSYQYVYCIQNSQLPEGNLAKIKFKALKKGTTSITLVDTSRLLRRVTDPEVNIPYETRSLTINIMDKAIDEKPGAPMASIQSGQYAGEISVALTCSTAGAAIYYTMDGSSPTTSSALYTNPVIIKKSTTLKAISVKNKLSSDVSTFEYTIKEAENPTPTPTTKPTPTVKPSPTPLPTSTPTPTAKPTPKPTAKELFSDNFESRKFTRGGWENKGSDIVREKTYVARFNNNDTLAKSLTTKGYKKIQVKYSRYTKGFEKGDSFKVEWYDGKTWKALENLKANSKWTTKTWKLSSKADNNTKFKLRFSASKLGSKDYAYIDNVEITGYK